MPKNLIVLIFTWIFIGTIVSGHTTKSSSQTKSARTVQQKQNVKKAPKNNKTTATFSDSLSLLKAVIIVGKGEDGMMESINEFKEVANYLRSLGVQTSEFYDTYANWDSIKIAAEDAHFFIYHGHGTNKGENGSAGGLVLSNYNTISSATISNELHLHKGALVLFQSVCMGAGSSADDNNDIGIKEAVQRVTDYSKPFIGNGASCYYACNYGESALSFLKDFFSKKSIKTIFEESYSFWTKIEYTSTCFYNKNYIISVTSKQPTPNTYTTRISYIYGKRKEEKVKCFKSYEKAYVGIPDFTINNLLKQVKSAHFFTIEYNKGIEAYKKGQYKDAFNYFSEAQFCIDKPKKSDVKNWLLRTNKHLAGQIKNNHWQANYYYVSPFYEDLASVYKNGKYGFVNPEGELLIDLKYDEVTPFKNGLARVLINNLAGLINSKGDIILDCLFDQLYWVDKNVFVLGKNHKFFLYNSDQLKVISNAYDYINWLGNELFEISLNDSVRYESKKGLMNFTGNVIHEPEFIEFSKLTNGYAVVKKNNQYAIMNALGQLLTKFTDEKLENKANGFFIKEKELYKFNGKKLKSINGENPEPFGVGYYLVSNNGLKGVVDEHGKIIVPIKFDEISPLQENMVYIVKQNKSFGLYHKTGKMLLKPVYQQIDDFKDGMAIVKQNGRYGFINTAGKISVPILYNKVEQFSEGMAVVCRQPKYGFIDTNNQIKIPFEYNWAESFKNGQAMVKKKRDIFYIDATGNKIKNPVKPKESISDKDYFDRKNGVIYHSAKHTAEIKEKYNKLTEISSSRFLYDTLFQVGNYWLSYYQLLHIDINKLKRITGSLQEYLYWLNFVGAGEHNYLRTDYYVQNNTIDIRLIERKLVFLTPDTMLIKAAQLHCTDMLTQYYFSHDSKDGRTFALRIHNQGFVSDGVSENIACYQKSIADVMSGWFSSLGHYSGIVDKYNTFMGMGCDNRYWCVNFGCDIPEGEHYKALKKACNAQIPKNSPIIFKHSSFDFRYRVIE